MVAVFIFIVILIALISGSLRSAETLYQKLRDRTSAYAKITHLGRATVSLESEECVDVTYSGVNGSELNCKKDIADQVYSVLCLDRDLPKEPAVGQSQYRWKRCPLLEPVHMEEIWYSTTTGKLKPFLEINGRLQRDGDRTIFNLFYNDLSPRMSRVNLAKPLNFRADCKSRSLQLCYRTSSRNRASIIGTYYEVEQLSNAKDVFNLPKSIIITAEDRIVHVHSCTTLENEMYDCTEDSSHASLLFSTSIRRYSITLRHLFAFLGVVAISITIAAFVFLNSCCNWNPCPKCPNPKRRSSECIEMLQVSQQ